MRTYVLALAIAASLTAAGTAGAATQQAFTVHSIAGILNTGKSVKLLGGTANGTLGTGALVMHNHLISETKGYGKYTLYETTGTLHGSYKLGARVGGPHGVKGYTIVFGTGTITGGTGSYAGDTGSFKMSGKSPAGDDFFYLKFVGTYATA